MKKASGFTLIELMVTLAVLAVLATIAIPNLSDFLIRSQRQQVVSEVSSALAYARSEAIKRAVPVTLEAKTTGVGSLQDGWRIFTDPNSTATYDSSSGSVTTLLADQNAYPANEVRIGRVGSNPRVNASGAEYLTFDGQGRSIIGMGSTGNGIYGFTVAIRRSGVDKAKMALCMSWAGRIRTVADKADNETGGCV